jgi:tRNA dimethylallyltransferase
VKVIVVSGPTACGKTATAIELAKIFGGEVVNFDSLLLYRELNIGTAKPTLEEMAQVPHHMVNVQSICDPLNAADYAKIALPMVQKILDDGKLVFLVGGSGFYLQALLKGMYDSPSTPDEVTERSDSLYAAEGIGPFLDILEIYDPKSFERYHANDHYRVRRAVEHWWANGTPLHEEREKKDSSNAHLDRDNVHGWSLLHLYLNLPKEEHAKIIEKRTEKMLQDGLVKEVEELLKNGFSGREKPFQSIGYKETLAYLRREFDSEESFKERINISTRQLAKSQRTWFNRDRTKMKSWL